MGTGISSCHNHITIKNLEHADGQTTDSFAGIDEDSGVKLQGKKVVLPSSLTRTQVTKRGLLLEEQDKMKTPSHIDQYISSEIPEKNEDPEQYQIVIDHMMHGPCGADLPTCPCTGPDRVTAALEDVDVDEIKDYYDCRYLSACEPSWRIYGFDIHYRFPPVDRLSFHLLGEQSVIFDATDSIDYALDKAFQNIMYGDKKKGFGCQDKKVRGVEDWIDFKTFDDVVYPTYKDACQARGLLEDDKEYIDGILEAILWRLVSDELKYNKDVLREEHQRLYNSDLDELIRMSKLIIWDEAPMTH
ncbi:hypothetical protein Tco_0941538 [Tanacetum coccineum]|uniref:Uncharacterized protein n=1 Tax=Tanacetum coccineum TaxID=301880 RepID=A0ABQ5DSP7_9ASTR